LKNLLLFKIKFLNLKYTDNTLDRILEAVPGTLGCLVLVWRVFFKIPNPV